MPSTCGRCCLRYRFLRSCSIVIVTALRLAKKGEFWRRRFQGRSLFRYPARIICCWRKNRPGRCFATRSRSSCAFDPLRYPRKRPPAPWDWSAGSWSHIPLLLLFLRARVVFRVDVVKLQRRLPVHLHDHLAAGHGVVVHVGIEEREAALGKGGHLLRLKVVSHTQFERSLKDGDVLAIRMEVGGDAESVGHFDADGEVTTRGPRVAFEHGELSAGVQEGRPRTPRNGIRGERVGFVGSGLGGHRPERNGAAQHSKNSEYSIQIGFQLLPPEFKYR